MWGIELSRGSELSLTRQIYQSLRDAIFDGRIKPGEALPSTRELAGKLSVARNTVNEAYEMLLAEGYIVVRQGALTRVAEALTLTRSASHAPPRNTMKSHSPYIADFRTGQPDLRYFPRYQWNRLAHRAADDLSAEQFGYSGPEGLSQLREEISAWLFRSRGVVTEPHSIVVTGGATHALHLLADLLYVEGKEILIEDPCHLGMLRALLGKGHRVRPVPVDSHGIQTEHLDGHNACAIYVTPSHQFPLGGILPANRRAALVRVARDHDLYIIEDDYDSEFRYNGAPVAPMYSIDPQRVIYVGTFSKILFPALRVGYVVLPERLHDRWRYLRTHADVQNSPFEQAALAEYLRTRKLDRHVNKMRKIYGQRREVLLQSLFEAFAEDCIPWGDAAGLHTAVAFPGLTFGQEFTNLCKSHHIRAVPVEYHAINKGTHMDKLLLGYGHLDPAEIRQGVALLSKVIQR